MDVSDGIPLNNRKRKAVDVEICIICQNPSGKKLTSTVNGREKIIEGSLKIGDNLLRDVNKEDYSKIKYHTKCYKPYILSSKRAKIDTVPCVSTPIYCLFSTRHVTLMSLIIFILRAYSFK